MRVHHHRSHEWHPSAWLVVALLIRFQPVAAAGQTAAFHPDITRIVPVVAEQYDLELFKVGTAEARKARAESLGQGLPGIERVDPLADPDNLLRHLAALALLESAIDSSDRVPAKWLRDLLAGYGQLVSMEGRFARLMTGVAIWSWQQGESAGPMVAFVDQLQRVPAYARRGIRWLADRWPEKADRQALIRGLAQVQRREGDWAGLLQSAQSLARTGAPDAMLVEAEARSELGEPDKADALLAKASDAPEAARLTAVLRQRAARARARGNWAELSRLRLQLGEPWAVLAQWTPERVHVLADPSLDETYLQALTDSGADADALWRFCSQARGRPPTPSFIERRIGVGLSVLVKGILVPGARASSSSGIAGLLAADLKALARSKPVLAESTALQLGLLRVLQGADLLEQVDGLAASAAAFIGRHPTHPLSVQLAYLLTFLGKRPAADVQAVEAFLQRMTASATGDADLATLAAGAVVQALAHDESQRLAPVRLLLEQRLKVQTSASLLLWKAHLRSAAGIFSGRAAATEWQQEMVDAYAAVVAHLGQSERVSPHPTDVCDAAASVATLFVAAGSPGQAAALLRQFDPVCQEDPQTRVVEAIVALIAGDEASEGGPDPVVVIEQSLPALASFQGQLQAHLWLAHAAGKGASRQAFDRARELLKKAAGRGMRLFPGPDARSWLVVSGHFALQVAHRPEHPFGIELTITVTPRMCLFPAAPIKEEQLQLLRSGTK